MNKSTCSTIIAATLAVAAGSAASATPLPAGYTQHTYIKGNATVSGSSTTSANAGYVITDIVPDPAQDTIDAVFKIGDGLSSKELWCARTSADVGTLSLLYGSGGQKKIRFDYYNSYAKTSSKTYEPGESVAIHVAGGECRLTKVDGTSETLSYGNQSSFHATGGPLMFLALGNYSGSSYAMIENNYNNGRLYSFTITRNGAVIHDLVPAVRNSDGQPGLYDNVPGGKFYPGTGSFTMGGILPDGYVELEYVASTGTQYLDTGVKPTRYFRAVVDFEFSAATGGGGFGYGATAAGPSIRFWRSSDGTLYRVNFNNSYNTETIFPTTFTDEPKRHVADLSDSLKTIDGVSFGDSPGLTQSLAGTFYLFAMRWGWSPYIGNYGSYRVYSCRLYEGAIIVRDFIPARRVSDDAVGLYDLDNGSFYTGAGTGSLTAGPDVVPEVAGDVLTIAGHPAEYGAPSPDYGEVEGWGPGATVALSCPPAVTNAGGTFVAECAGWTATPALGEETSGAGTQTTLTYSNETSQTTFTWRWTEKPLVTAAAGANGSVTFSDGFYAVGSEIGAAAVPDEGYVFLGWDGLPDGVAQTNPLRFTLGRETDGVALAARFGSADDYCAIDLANGDQTITIPAGESRIVAVASGNASATLTVTGGGDMVFPDGDSPYDCANLVIDGVMVRISSESQLGGGQVTILHGGGLVCEEGFTQAARPITIQSGSTGVVEVASGKTVVFKPDYFASASATFVKRGAGRLQMEGAWRAADARWIADEGTLYLYGTLDTPPVVEVHEGAWFLFHRNLYQIAIGDVVLRGGSIAHVTPWMSTPGKNLLRHTETIARLTLGKVSALPSRDGRHSYISAGIFYTSGTSVFDVEEGAVLDLDSSLQPDGWNFRSLRKTGDGVLRLLKSPFSDRGGIAVEEGTLALAGHNVRVPRGVPLSVADGARFVLEDGAALDQAQDFPGSLLAEAAVWIDATRLKGFSNGSSLSYIPNLGSAGGLFGPQGVGPSAPVFRFAALNGMPALDAPVGNAGSGLKLVGSYCNAGAELSTYVVASGTNITFANAVNGKDASPIGFGTTQGGSTAAGGFRYEWKSDNQFNVCFSGDGSKMSVSNDAVSLSSGPFLSAARRDATTASLAHYRGDALPEFTQETTGAFLDYDIASMGLFMRVSNAEGSIWSGNCWPGQIGEVLVFSRRLTDDEDEAVRGYLAKKWFASAREWAAMPAYSPAQALPVTVAAADSAALCLDQDGGDVFSAVAKLGGGELVDFSASRGDRTLDVREGRAAFAPSTNAWCPAAVWFDAADTAALSTNGAAVLSVRNKGWAGGEFLPRNDDGTATATPTVGGINGRPAVVFDGDDFLRTRAFTNSTPRELYVYLVRQQDAYVQNAGLFVHASASALADAADGAATGAVVGYLSNTQNISLDSGNNDLWLAGAGANGVAVIDFFHVGDYRVCFGELAAANAATNVYAIRQAGAPSDADRATVNDLFHIGSRIGAGDVPKTFLKGRVGELLAFEEPLNVTQTEELINYLRKKWMGVGDGSATPPRWLANAGTEVETAGRLAVRQAAGTELGQNVGTVALSSYVSEGAAAWTRDAALDGPLFSVAGDMAFGGPAALTLNPFPRKGYSRTLATYGGDCTGFVRGWTCAGEGMSGNPKVRHLSAEKRILLEFVSPMTVILLQ